MAKKVKKIKIKLKMQIEAGKATPAPPVGPILGQYGVPLMDFCKDFNAKTADMMGNVIPIDLIVYEDRTYEFKTKTPVTTDLILKAINKPKGSGVPNKDKVGKLPKAKLEEIAMTKMPDLNTNDLEQAKLIIAGTAKSMGVEIEK